MEKDTKKQKDTSAIVTEPDQEELEKLKKQTEEYLNNWKRERADFLNYKKEESKRIEVLIKFANEAFVIELLDRIEPLEIAIKSIPEQIKNEKNAKEWLDGLRQIVNKFEDMLEKFGVARIETEGEKFDPSIHEAVSVETRGDGSGEESEKIEELRPGYVMNGKVIRPARIKLIKNK
jgi:molecular chaperone GrpE